jgi:hypothetical protein
MREDGDASDKPLDIAVLTRIKQFRAMNKLKKVALKVRTSLMIIIVISSFFFIKTRRKN